MPWRDTFHLSSFAYWVFRSFLSNTLFLILLFSLTCLRITLAKVQSRAVMVTLKKS